ncbi:tetratricopeptide repeat protein [Paraferrimonas sp. SM1919]|uniref:YfgM family protein n=1 Tax=Paraferrimonas sp. SM1919 TaxID=2662263 RepID=UPI0013CFE489|nr:tetratricopeptide repeat protein [Paraferrimonas sp. SM1919]
MDIHSTEQQQEEKLKQLWQEYGVSVVSGIALGLAGLGGWNYYSDIQVQKTQAASQEFQNILENKEGTELVEAAQVYATNHSQQGYQALLNLSAAKVAVEAKDFSKAETLLAAVVAEGGFSGQIAALRLARVQKHQAKYDDALAELEKVSSESFAAQKNELKGDIYVDLKQYSEAREAYQAALAVQDINAASAVQLKLDNLNSIS